MSLTFVIEKSNSGNSLNVSLETGAPLPPEERRREMEEALKERVNEAAQKIFQQGFAGKIRVTGTRADLLEAQIRTNEKGTEKARGNKKEGKNTPTVTYLLHYFASHFERCVERGKYDADGYERANRRADENRLAVSFEQDPDAMWIGLPSRSKRARMEEKAINRGETPVLEGEIHLRVSKNGRFCCEESALSHLNRISQGLRELRGEVDSKLGRLLSEHRRWVDVKGTFEDIQAGFPSAIKAYLEFQQADSIEEENRAYAQCQRAVEKHRLALEIFCDGKNKNQKGQRVEAIISSKRLTP